MTTRLGRRRTRAGALAAVAAVAAITAVVAISAQAAAPRPSPTPVVPQSVVARVDGLEISRQAFDEYTAVFTDPGGASAPNPDDILLSLINQAVVHEHALRAGVEIDPTEVQAHVEGAISILPSGAPSLARAGGEAGLRKRVVAFLEFRAMYNMLTGGVVTDAPAADQPREGGELGTDPAWLAWLTRARECSDITVLDPTFTITSSSPSPACTVTP